MSMGVMMVPDILSHMPDWIANIFASPVTMAGITAVLLDIILPKSPTLAPVTINEVPAAKSTS